MRIGRAILFGVLGAAAISLASALLRTLGVQIRLEMILGTLTGMPPSAEAFTVGLAIHLAIGAAFGILYGYLFESVWDHGGAGTGMFLSAPHAALVGMFIGLTPQFHPFVPEVIPDPGPYFANEGILGVLAFFALHALYGAIIGAGYGHVRAEHEWAPEGRL